MNAPVPASRLPGLRPGIALRSSRGFSLPELLVASAVFLFVILAAYQAFQRSQESYRLGQNQAEMVQAARVAFDQMGADVRLAGFEFDVDGENEPYPNQPDEAIEFMHRRAIVVRANFDFLKELQGREPGLEIDPAGQAVECCPVVTTANDEIVGFALGKASGTQPPGTITFDADVDGTVDVNDALLRDAVVETDGDITGEETVTRAGFELRDPSDANYAPPYTLYRFRVKDPYSQADPVSLEPLIDNVYSLEFSYFDSAGNEIIGPNVAGTQADWGGDNNKDKEAGRALRWRVAQVKVKVVTLTPDSDMRLRARGTATGVDHFQGKRKYTLEADLIPPNLGRRGARDRDINPPEPPRNVQVCTGECGMVRVSWDPGPPEDKVASHIITLCDGDCNDDGSNFFFSDIIIANFDATTNREYVVFSAEQDSDFWSAGDIYARVVARNVSGTESECPVPGCPECCESATGAALDDRARPDTFPSGHGGGYDPADANFPDAKADNSSGQLIVTDPTSPYFPASLESLVSLEAPVFALNKSAGAGTAPNDWTTKDLGAGVTAPLSCFQQESTPADANDDPAYRTPYTAFRRDPERGNTYVWRVSGASNANNAWGGATAPRNFVPTQGNLYDFTYLALDGGSLVYPDESGYTFTDTPSGPRYDGFQTNFIEPGAAGLVSRPVRAVTPCEVYYYRFRATSLCWDDKTGGTVDADGNPTPDGINDVNQPMSAWFVAADRPGTYRADAMSISPFYPPMLNAGDTSGNRDRPDQGVHDSDAYANAGAVDTYALPSYSLPQRVVDDVTGAITGWVKPERPSEFYMTRVSDQGGSFLTAGGNANRFDARLLFNAGRRTAPEAGEGDAHPAAFRTYRLYRKAASSATPVAADYVFDAGTATLVKSFDSRAPNDVRHYTLAGGDLVPGPDTNPALTELNDKGSDWAPGSTAGCSQDPDDWDPLEVCIPYIYWLRTAQCVNFDDGIDTAAAENSVASDGFAFPCRLHFDVRSITVDPPTAPTAPNQVRWEAEILDENGDPDCSSIQSARLLAFRNDGPYIGDFLGSSDWKQAEPGEAPTCGPNNMFQNSFVNEAVRGYSGAVKFVVEISTADETGIDPDLTDGDYANPVGCRLRSDFGPGAAAEGVAVLDVTACGDPTLIDNCGTNQTDSDGSDTMPDTDPATLPPGRIFGYFDQDQVELSNSDQTMTIHVPKLDTCSQDFSLVGLELKLVKNTLSGDNALPDLVSAQIVGGIAGGTFTLPDLTRNSAADLWVGGDSDDAEDDAGERDLNGADGNITLRWRDSFCTLTADPNDPPLEKLCSYPLVQGNASELTIQLEFDGPLCDVTVAQFNFRVPFAKAGDGSITDEMICTQRAKRPDDRPHVGTPDCTTADCTDPGIDPACRTACRTVDRNLCPTVGVDPDGHVVPVGADPDPPVGCRIEGAGRGGYTTPESQCLECTENCEPCQCPINDNDTDIAQDIDPTFTLLDDPDDPNGGRSNLLTLHYQQGTGTPCSSPECAFRITEIRIRMECTGDRDCAGGELPGKLQDNVPPGVPDAKLVHNSPAGPDAALPAPTQRLQNDPSFREYRWTGLSIDIAQSEAFDLVFRFDDSVDRMNLVDVDIRVGRPMPFECNADGTPGGAQAALCALPAAAIYLQ